VKQRFEKGLSFQPDLQTFLFLVLSSAGSQQKQKFTSFFSLFLTGYFFPFLLILIAVIYGSASELPLFWSKLLLNSFNYCCWEGPGDLADFLLFGLQCLPAAISAVFMCLL
jgi:hypothetical protein